MSRWGWERESAVRLGQLGAWATACTVLEIRGAGGGSWRGRFLCLPVSATHKIGTRASLSQSEAILDELLICWLPSPLPGHIPCLLTVASHFRCYHLVENDGMGTVRHIRTLESRVGQQHDADECIQRNIFSCRDVRLDIGIHFPCCRFFMQWITQVVYSIRAGPIISDIHPVHKPLLTSPHQPDGNLEFPVQLERQ